MQQLSDATLPWPQTPLAISVIQAAPCPRFLPHWFLLHWFPPLFIFGMAFSFSPGVVGFSRAPPQTAARPGQPP